MPDPVLESTRSSVISGELELQLMVGNAIAALLTLQVDPADPGSRASISDVAQRLLDGSADPSEPTRTVGHVSSALTVLAAARGARGVGAREGMRQLAEDLAASVKSSQVDTPRTENLVARLVTLHRTLALATAPAPEEVRRLENAIG